ncbi:hypothetical protein CEXT_208241 [Caerostris extrusa]|uniref:Uncharacterized protein n=1 Tax=Caerostris extrusa TaxID=172846 RepID=A0AAV4MDL3_CAEEX|nr:hypothetical protein CEXT_208241 [Caerostris extrusa]
MSPDSAEESKGPPSPRTSSALSSATPIPTNFGDFIIVQMALIKPPSPVHPHPGAFVQRRNTPRNGSLLFKKDLEMEESQLILLLVITAP